MSSLQQRPDLTRVILESLLVAIEQLTRVARVEQAPLAGLRIQQHLASVRAELAAKPVGHRKLEAPLGTVEDLVGNPAAQCRSKGDLLLAPLNLQPRRSGGDELHQLVIEQR
jgi:hypothetical protein